MVSFVRSTSEIRTLPSSRILHSFISAGAGRGRACHRRGAFSVVRTSEWTSPGGRHVCPSASHTRISTLLSEIRASWSKTDKFKIPFHSHSPPPIRHDFVLIRVPRNQWMVVTFRKSFSIHDLNGTLVVSSLNLAYWLFTLKSCISKTISASVVTFLSDMRSRVSNSPRILQ